MFAAVGRKRQVVLVMVCSVLKEMSLAMVSVVLLALKERKKRKKRKKKKQKTKQRVVGTVSEHLKAVAFLTPFFEIEGRCNELLCFLS